jgi:hypothetical protein
LTCDFWAENGKKKIGAAEAASATNPTDRRWRSNDRGHRLRPFAEPVVLWVVLRS